MKNDLYICEKCGATMRHMDAKKCGDDLLCPICGCDALEDAVVCDICGEIVSAHDAEGLDHDVCHKCIEEKRYDLDYLTAVGGGSLTEISLNSFLADQFTVEEIEDLMLTSLKWRSKVDPVDGMEFLTHNGYDAAETLFEMTNN